MLITVLSQLQAHEYFIIAASSIMDLPNRSSETYDLSHEYQGLKKHECQSEKLRTQDV